MASSYSQVVIIGGGPAGAAAAINLARAGRQVLILERERFPRHHVGESTLLSIHSSLRWLGLTEKVEAAGFRRKTGASYIWGMDRIPWSFHFREIESLPEARGWRQPYSYEVEREVFDKILLEHAVESGARLREAEVAEFLLEEGGVHGVQLGTGERIEAEVVLDASGQKCLAGRMFGWRDMNPRLRNAALYGYWSGGPPRYELVGGDMTPADRSNIFICSTSWGWIWFIPQRGERVSVGAVLAGGSDRPPITTLESTYLELLYGCEETVPLFAHLLLNRSEPIRSISDWSYSCRQFALPGLFLAGDAACFVDPILSSGLHLALRGGSSAAFATNAILAGQDPALVRQWYESTYRAAYRDYERMALWWYHGDRNRESWFDVARSLISREGFGKDLSARAAFVQIASGLQPLPYVTVDVPGPGRPIKMCSLFHMHASFNRNLDQLREKFGVVVSSPGEDAACVRPADGERAGPGPRFTSGVMLTMEPEPERRTLAICARAPRASGPDQRIDLTPFWPVFRHLDGTRKLSEVAVQLGLRDDECGLLEALARRLERAGVLEGVTAAAPRAVDHASVAWGSAGS